MTRRPIDYARLAAELLSRADYYVSTWLPNGYEKAGRWYVGDFDGSPGKSANVDLRTGTWIDNGNADDKGGDLISLYARIRNLSNHDAAIELMRDLGWERPRDDDGPANVRTPAQPTATPAESEMGGGPAPGPERAAIPSPRGARWKPIAPVPPHAPKPTFVWKYHDKKRDQWVEATPTRTWAYEFEGQLYGHVARFERVSSEGEISKDTLPHTWCEDTTDPRGSQRWSWKQWAEPRPLYVPAGLLSGDLSLPVVIVEGEKCAEAGFKLLGHEFDFVSWPGGCKTWSMAQWSWIMGRSVILWPDCDAQHERLTAAERASGVDKKSKPLLPESKQPGMQAMVHIGSLLVAEHGCSVSICRIPKPGDVGDGWDIADAIDQGWTAEQVRSFLRGAVTFVPPSDEARAKARAPESTPSNAGAEQGDLPPSWRSKLIEAANGSIKPARENVVLALDGCDDGKGGWIQGVQEARGVIAFNEFTNDVVKLRDTPWGTKAGIWDEADELELGNWLTRTHWLPPMSRQTLEEAVTMVARRHRYHPVRERLEARRGQWDEQPRLATWLAHCCRKEGVLPDDDPLQKYLARVGTWLFMAIVARIMRPGCKFDYMLILEGGQGMGKSTLCSELAIDWFADTGLVLGDKDSYQNLQGILVYEWGELDSLTRAEVTKVKQFVSSQKDRFRASFDRRPKDYPRQVVFIGTTNESHYLSDPTGNRRFWPVRVTRPIDLDWLRDNLDQLYAEALHYFEAGHRFHPTQREQVELFDPQQLERTVENALESAIRKYLYDENQRITINGQNGTLLNEITLADLLTALGISVDKQTQLLTKQASAALGRLGWERGRASAKTSDGAKVRPWVYRRPTTAAIAPQPADAPAVDSTNSPAPGYAKEEDDLPI